ncbi:MAG TPA: hypothetical protein VLS49_07140 [Usitatibacter sp.]|nr:hypothetical protein [Usitatibacter sp.]
MERPRIGAMPIVLVVILGFAIPYLAAIAAALASRYLHTPSARGPLLPWLYVHHAFQLAQIYAVALGILYAYWFEKSRSIAAPIVGHDVSDFVEDAIVFALAAAWS